MSYVISNPEAVTAAADTLASIGSALRAQNAATASPTTSVTPAAADQVSARTAEVFSALGRLYQEVSTQASAILDVCVADLYTGARSYAAAESANAMATS